MSAISFDFKIDASNIVKEVNEVCDDTYVRVAVHRLLAKMCEEYVPYDTGALSNSVKYTQDGVIYSAYSEDGTNYAHYIYEGIVYGPNFKVVMPDGSIQWKSPALGPGSKYKTDRNLTYDTTTHPKATSHWDKVMMTEKGDEFAERVHQIIQRRLKKLNG